MKRTQRVKKDRKKIQERNDIYSVPHQEYPQLLQKHHELTMTPQMKTLQIVLTGLPEKVTATNQVQEGT